MSSWIIVSLVVWLVFWFCCYLGTGSDEKNLIGLRSYPDEVIDIVKKQPNLKVPQDKSIPQILIGNFVMFTIICVVIGFVFKEYLHLVSFVQAFLFFLLLTEGLGVFDLVVIDLLWWRNTERIRFSFLKDKSYYQNPKKHIDSFIRGIPLFIVASLVSAYIVNLLYK